MLPADWRSIRWEHLEALVTSGARETRHLEFKRDLPNFGATGKKSPEDGRREFLKDISAMANAGGGDIIYGLDEDDHRASELVGVVDSGRVSTLLQLEQILDNGLEPRVNRRATWVDSGDGRVAMVYRIPFSFQAPHRRLGDGKFYTRNAEGCTEMDVSMLREAFLGSASTASKAQSFRKHRVAEWDTGDNYSGSVRPLILAHVIPLASVAGGPTLDMAPLAAGHLNLLPLGAKSDECETRLNFDGVLCSRRGEAAGEVQLYRSGIVESADREVIGAIWEPGNPRLWMRDVEQGIHDRVADYLELLEGLGLMPPYLMAITLLGVERAILTLPRMPSGSTRRPIDRRVLMLPEVWVESARPNLQALLRPAWDVLWQAGGIPRDPNYNESGEWRPSYH
jgi:hypothetical protein